MDIDSTDAKTNSSGPRSLFAQDELRRVERVRYADDTQSWMAVTVLCDAEGNTKRNSASRDGLHMNDGQSSFE